MQKLVLTSWNWVTDIIFDVTKPLNTFLANVNQKITGKCATCTIFILFHLGTQQTEMSELSRGNDVTGLERQMIMQWLCLDHMIQQGVWPMGYWCHWFGETNDYAMVVFRSHDTAGSLANRVLMSLVWRDKWRPGYQSTNDLAVPTHHIYMTHFATVCQNLHSHDHLHLF